MSKTLMILLGIVFVISASAYAADNYSLSGQVTFSGQDDIYLCLYTIENFPQYKKTLPPEPFVRKIKPSPKQIEGGRLPFTFSGVPKGTYCIIAFQDVDNNGRLTCNTWGGIEEAMCFYKESPSCEFSMTSWNDVKFELDKDISGIGMKLD
jgi:uncharacterized protein (DUF2141 family)